MQLTSKARITDENPCISKNAFAAKEITIRFNIKDITKNFKLSFIEISCSWILIFLVESNKTTTKAIMLKLARNIPPKSIIGLPL